MPTAIESRVVEAALSIADEVGWEQVRLHAIADRTGLSLPEIGARFRDVDAIANAWFAQARQATLAVTAEELDGRLADERLSIAFGRWLDHLTPQREVARQILRYKLHPPHLHHWVPLVFDLSRLVHDILDVARVEGAGRLRQAQEVGLTLIVLATLREWLRDDSPAQEWSKERLARRLGRAGRLARRIDRTAEPGA
jgi:AcrR family transcriptional regulator